MSCLRGQGPRSHLLGDQGWGTRTPRWEIRTPWWGGCKAPRCWTRTPGERWRGSSSKALFCGGQSRAALACYLPCSTARTTPPLIPGFQCLSSRGACPMRPTTLPPCVVLHPALGAAPCTACCQLLPGECCSSFCASPPCAAWKRRPSCFLLRLAPRPRASPVRSPHSMLLQCRPHTILRQCPPCCWPESPGVLRRVLAAVGLDLHAGAQAQPSCGH